MCLQSQQKKLSVTQRQIAVHQSVLISAALYVSEQTFGSKTTADSILPQMTKADNQNSRTHI